MRFGPISAVALRKESVDRNDELLDEELSNLGSLSARRAWIEMSVLPDRSGLIPSLSARRAWIEIKAA